MKEFVLGNGVALPAVGFGVYQGAVTQGPEPVAMALEAGYRYIDTAAFYHTEEFVAQAVASSGIPREEICIASKVWRTDLGYENVKRSFSESLERLQTDYLDLFLIHWPKPEPLYPDWKLLDIESWCAMEEIYESGQARAIGVSNFLPHHLENLKEHCRILPMVDQLEFHPGYTQPAAVSYCRENGMLVQAWSPMGRARVFKEPLILELAEKYGVSPAKICLLYDVQRGVMVLPKASSAARIRDNLDLFSVTLSQEDLYRIDTLPQCGWSGEHPDRETVKPEIS